MGNGLVGREALTTWLAVHPNWRLASGRLKTEYEFSDFKASIAFMVMVASEAERLAHHPGWSNAYNRVKIELCTNDFGCQVTDLDLTLAEFIEVAAQRIGGKAGCN